MIECPKCHYVQQPDDYSPEGECPRCGIVYKKFVERQSVMFGHHDPDFEAPPIRRPGFGLKGVALVLVLACLLSGFFIWKYRDNPSDNQEYASDTDGSVVMYSTPNCPYCRVAKAFFRKHDIDFLEYDITSSEKGRREFRKLNGRGVPLIIVGNKRIDGYNEHLLRKALEQEGFL